MQQWTDRDDALVAQYFAEAEAEDHAADMRAMCSRLYEANRLMRQWRSTSFVMFGLGVVLGAVAWAVCR